MTRKEHFYKKSKQIQSKMTNYFKNLFALRFLTPVRQILSLFPNLQ
jgi:hypothetical protein